MKPSVGSTLHFAPCNRGFVAQLDAEDGRSWIEPVIGWACVVSWTRYDSDDETPESGADFDTELQPVMLSSEGVTRTATDLLLGEDEVGLRRVFLPGMTLPAPPAEQVDPEEQG